MRRTDNTPKRAASTRKPPPELLPFLDALAELLANDLEREQAEAEQQQRRKEGAT